MKDQPIARLASLNSNTFKDTESAPKNQDLTKAFLSLIAQEPAPMIDFRLIDDRNPDTPAINLRGTLTKHLPTLHTYNAAGYGVFYNVNAMKPEGRKTLENVHSIRVHVVDLDDPLTSQDSYNRACASDMPPHLAVQTSPGKYHLYWLVEPYTGNDFYTEQQRKLVQLYGGDKAVTDATRVMRVPGFYHSKGVPHLVTWWMI